MKSLKDCLNNISINESSNVKIDCTIKREPIETIINVKCYKYKTDDDTFDMTLEENTPNKIYEENIYGVISVEFDVIYNDNEYSCEFDIEFDEDTSEVTDAWLSDELTDNEWEQVLKTFSNYFNDNVIYDFIDDILNY